MAHSAQRAGSSKRTSSLPTPPSDGWTLLEAAEALCPQEAGLYQQGGTALETALRQEMGEWARFNPSLFPDGWLSRRLLAALRERPDLQLTGRNLAKGIHEPRAQLPHDLLAVAAKVDDEGGNSLLLLFRFQAGQSRLIYGVPRRPRGLPDIDDLVEVRIELSSQFKGKGRPSGSAAAKGSGQPKQPYTPERGAALLRRRVADHPKDQPAPSFEACLAAAQEHFAGHIAREPFRHLRNSIVPPDWQRRGPRGPRNLGPRRAPTR